jgi:uncharacterized protein
MTPTYNLVLTQVKENHMALGRTALAMVAMVTACIAQSQGNYDEYFAAARKGDVTALKSFLDKGVPVDAKWRYEMTALLMACMRGNTDAAKLLIERGADVNVKDSFYGSTALGAAAEKGDIELVRLLLAKGAKDRDSIVKAAVFEKNVPLLKAGLEGGKPSQDVLNEALTRAVGLGNQEMADLLRAAGAVETNKQ